ncbi:MAG TPA: xanthine dehydrogenase family protein subunit M [Noviherbaspirillum sp.]|jgi:carbon-monoxide dehydrogenase medium subunit|uniref:FAD binding domain-containing protein n=1 Tax=Noviherbaspirillum sp. TaxID=1926288 RepID=UPI002DDD7B14|nr:xanthine dehydrogenase family protein subunit M [Noviherbaspirillum sp.]HEV2612212.1 xanthine dehydrogenase family protein subunit M [Noviherbaspirillum sp.]
MYAFELHRPRSVSEAVALLAHPDSRPLAGGQSLIAAMKLRLASPASLVDLGGIDELRGIRREGDALVIGAGTRHAEIAASGDVRQAIPALAWMAGEIGDLQVRNVGTLGGAIANNDPAACYPAAVLGLNAIIRTDRRTIAADDFLKGMYETALASDELITAVEFPVPEKAAYIKFVNPASRFALVGVFVGRGKDGRVRVAVTGCAGCAFRVADLEKALEADFSPDAAKAVRVSSDNLSSDLHASADYRAHLIPVLTARAVAKALE